ncbi:MAG: alpha/beta hydrolase [Clostridia bacterium]|nr:alpha/beta hydrolase [Clostridia bacterium]
MKTKKILRTALFVLLALCILGTGAFGVYAAGYARAGESAVSALAAKEAYTVTETKRNIVFTPKEPNGTGFVFYQGGRVDERAYAPLMAHLASAGVTCVVTKMPANFAVFRSNAATDTVGSVPGVTRWYLGGHSLGGAMAASCAAKEPGRFAGLVLLAAYSTADLGDSGLPVLSVVGDRDGVLNRQSYDKYRANLPKGFEEVVLRGANHAGFGDYGAQAGDNEAAMSHREQWQTTADAILGFMENGRK